MSVCVLCVCVLCMCNASFLMCVCVFCVRARAPVRKRDKVRETQEEEGVYVRVCVYVCQRESREVGTEGQRDRGTKADREGGRERERDHTPYCLRLNS